MFRGHSEEKKKKEEGKLRTSRLAAKKNHKRPPTGRRGIKKRVGGLTKRGKRGLGRA